jgi:hypothetical protein
MSAPRVTAPAGQGRSASRRPEIGAEADGVGARWCEAAPPGIDCQAQGFECLDAQDRLGHVTHEDRGRRFPVGDPEDRRTGVELDPPARPAPR